MLRAFQYKTRYTLSYAEYGERSGFPILLQHGLIASIKDYQIFDRLISLGARLVCMARPGYGESSPYELKDYVEWAEIVGGLAVELGLSQFDVLGISSGAPYSYAIGYKLPEKARNIFILSGMPALYDETILSIWPHAMDKKAKLTELEDLAQHWFFSNLSPADLANDNVRDSLRNHYFGVAQDLKLRRVNWGFYLSDVKQPVFMRHSRADDNIPLVTAQMTARLLPNCTLDIRENDPHFSDEVLDDFIQTIMAGWYRS
jgi:pimeloyl-ACP methyl ester carboxylesterase